MADPPAPVRVRIAPSPTGFFHVGNARTAVFNWLFARQQGGRFIWRVEDTDRSRHVEAALEDQAESLSWLGLDPDEGPLSGGRYGPYFQSERLALYDEHVAALVAGGHAYRCFCTAERLEQVRRERAAAGQKVGYDRHCRNLSAADVAALEGSGRPAVVRLRMPLSGQIALDDVVRGRITFEAAEQEDVVLLKSDGYPTYHLAVVVDDHAMAISHVLRADEWIPSAPIQVVLYQAFGWPQPVWVHVPMVLNPDGKGKLSKRKTVDGSDGQLMVQVREHRAAGYLPEAMFNYLALLGWAYSADEEVFTREQAIARFDLTDIKPSPARWNPEKLLWLNGVYIRALPPEALAERLLPFLQAAGLPARLDEVRRLVPLIQERLGTLAEAVGLIDFFWAAEVTPDPVELVPKKRDAAGTAGALEQVSSVLSRVEPWTHEALEAALRELAATLGLSASAAFQPVRVAVTGKRVAPPLFETLEILGRETTLERLARARELLLAEPSAR
jgi:glutamyl-tRNA synthetase